MLTIDKVINDMKNCYQTEGQTIYQHGLSVRDFSIHILDYINGGRLDKLQVLPRWLEEYADRIKQKIVDKETLMNYTLFHDCGKPYCIEIVDGKRRFPNHAIVSANIWSQISNDKKVENLILHDMDIHLARADNAGLIANVQDSATLLISSVAEINSNAQMFGGTNSDSFKIKMKRIEKNGYKICRGIFNG